MYMKHSIEERLQAVQKCLKGHAPKCVARELGLNAHHVSEWLLRYQQAGIDGLQKRPNKRANFAEKCKIVCEYAEKGVSLQPNCIKLHFYYEKPTELCTNWRRRIYRSTAHKSYS